MPTYTLEKSFNMRAPLTPNVRKLAELFGLAASSDRKVTVIERCEIDIEPGQVVYITGASGAGKSVLLQMIKEKLDDVFDLDEQELPRGKPLVDCFDDDLDQSLRWLSLAGLSDVYALLQNPEQLSDGQRYRFRLALALAGNAGVICIDEFCAALERVSAAVVAHNVRKFADVFGTTFIVATSHDDLLEDLCPDTIVIKHLGGKCDILYPERNFDFMNN